MTVLEYDGFAWDILAARTAATPHKDFLRFYGESLTYERLAALSSDYAARLARFGVARGEIVPTFFGNSAAAVATWFALMRLGGVWAPINTEFRGEQLINAIRLTGASLLIVDARNVDGIRAVLGQLPQVRRIIVHGSAPPASSGTVEFSRLEELPGGSPPAPVRLERANLAMIQFTSGSTGVSKAVQLSHGYLVGQARLTSQYFDLRADDVLYSPFPLYHWDAAIGTVMGALVCDATAALAERFSVSRFWDDIRAFEATMFDYMGATLAFLPPYSPDLNPIENAFSKIKQLLRSAGHRTVDALWNDTQRVLDAITPADARGYFRHCGYTLDLR